ncbi:MAG: YqaJ viral recombinase family protein [Clostridia bacterium]|nr:YqaJ viral recombinase family protein [Clostridia bacterium]
MTREDWLKERKNGIGGSDAATIMGLNPYKTNVDLWEEKTGIKEADDISDKPYVHYGTVAEEHLRELFKLDFPQYDVKHEENTIIKHPIYPFLFASLDGILVDKETGEMGILEIKTTNILQSMQKEKWKDKIPDNYYCQILHYLNVTGYSFVILKAQLRYDYDGDIRLETKHYKILRKDVEEDIKILSEKEIYFWTEYVQKQKKPPLLLPEI